MDAPERLHARISQLESELAKCRAQAEAQAIEVEAAAQALEKQYLTQDATLRKIEQQRQDAAAEAAANFQELQKEKENRTKVERALAIRTSELEDSLLKGQLLKEQRVSLLDQLEQRKLEQQELKASLDAYVIKTTTLLEEKLQAERRADEAQLERMRSHGEHSKLQQRISHLEEQVSYLEAENEAKSRSLLEAQRRATEEQLSSRSQVADLQGQLEAKTTQEAYLSSVLEKKQLLLDDALTARAETERAAASEKLLLEGRLAAEKEAAAAMKELYEGGRERCKTLEETLVHLQTQIEESSSAHAEALQKSEEARQAAEELAEKRREQLEQMVVALPQESPQPASPVTPVPAPLTLRPRTPLRPDPELKVVPLHDDLTVQELYDEYMEMACAYQSEAAKCRQLQNYMDSVCEQLEGRAKVLQRQQEAYNRAVQERAQLVASVQTLQDERRMLEGQTAQAASQLEGALRRAAAIEQQNADATRQVEVLLAEMERLHGRPVPTVPPVPRKIPGVINAEDVINDKLVAFTNLPELLDQHKQMRAMIRSLVDELETTRSSAREEASRIVSERQAQLDSAMAAVASDQQRLQEALEVVAAQQDHYKQALASATTEIEKLRGTPNGAEHSGGERGAPARLALEAPVSSTARQELEELKQQLERVKQSSSQDMANLRQQLAEAHVKVAEAKAEVATANATQQHAEARIQDLLTHAEVLKQHRSENLQERQRLQQALNAAEQRLREAQAALEEKGEELFRARTKIAELEQDVTRERRAQSEASQKLMKLHLDTKNETVDLRYQLGMAAARQEALSRETKEAKEKVIAMEAEVGRLNSELLQEKSKLSTLKESDVLRIQSSFGLVKQFKEENTGMKAQVLEYQVKIKSEEEEREALQKAHDKLEEKVGLLEKELQESKDLISTMTSDHSQVVKGQQEELEQLRLEIKSKQEVADLGKKQLEAARQEVSFYQLAASTAGADAANVKADLEARNAELAGVKRQLEAAQKATADVQQALDKLREESQAKAGKLQEDLSHVKLQYQSTQQQLGARDAELREAKQQLEFIEASYNLDKEALQSAQEKLATAERQIEELAAALAATQKQRDSLQDKVTLSEQAHTSEVQALQQALQDLQLQAATYRLQSEKMTLDVMSSVTDETIMQTVEFLKQQQQSAEERVQQLQDDKQRLVLERDAAVREATESRAQVRNLEELTQKSIPPKVHRQRLDEAEGRVRHLREEVVALKAQLQDAETRHAAASNAGENKSVELEALQEQVSTLQSSLTETQEKLAVHEDLSKQWELRIQQLREKNDCVEKSEYEKLQQELEKTKKQLSSADSRKGSAFANRLQKQLAEMRQKHAADMNEQKTGSAKKYNELVRKFNLVTKSNQQFKKELEDMKAASASLQQQLTQLEQDHAQQLASRGKELNDLKAAELTLKAQLQAREELHAQMSSRMDSVRKQVDQALTDSVNKGREIDRLNRDKSQLVGQVTALRGEKQSLLQQLQARIPTPSITIASQTTPAPLTAQPTHPQPAHAARLLPQAQPPHSGPNHSRIPFPTTTQHATQAPTQPQTAGATHMPRPSAQLPSASTQLPTTSTQLPSLRPDTAAVPPSAPPPTNPPAASTSLPTPAETPLTKPAPAPAPTSRTAPVAAAPTPATTLSITPGNEAKQPSIPNAATTGTTTPAPESAAATAAQVPSIASTQAAQPPAAAAATASGQAAARQLPGTTVGTGAAAAQPPAGTTGKAGSQAAARQLPGTTAGTQAAGTQPPAVAVTGVQAAARQLPATTAGAGPAVTQPPAAATAGGQALAGQLPATTAGTATTAAQPPPAATAGVQAPAGQLPSTTAGTQAAAAQPPAAATAGGSATAGQPPAPTTAAGANTPATNAIPPRAAPPSTASPAAASPAATPAIPTTAGLSAMGGLRAARPAASETATSAPAGPAASSDAGLPPKADPANMLAWLKTRMASKVRKTNAGDSATTQGADSAVARQSVGEEVTNAIAAAAQQPSPSTKRARIESTDSTAEVQEVGEGEGGKDDTTDVTEAAVTSPPIAKRQKVPDTPGKASEGSFPLTPLKDTTMAEDKVATTPAGIEAPARAVDGAASVATLSTGGGVASGDLPKADGVPLADGVPAEDAGDVDMKSADVVNEGQGAAVRRLFGGVEVSALTQQDKGSEPGDLRMEDGAKEGERESQAPSEMQLPSELDEEFIEIEDSGMEDADLDGEQEADEQSQQPSQVVQDDIMDEHGHNSDAIQGAAPTLPHAAGDSHPEHSMAEAPTCIADIPPTQPGGAISNADVPPTQPAIAISNADVPPTQPAGAINNADIPLTQPAGAISNAEQDVNINAASPGVVSTLTNPVGVAPTPPASEERPHVSDQSLERFEALHYLTLQLDAKNVTENNPHLLLGSIPNGMPPYDKPLLYLSNERADEAGGSLPPDQDPSTQVQQPVPPTQEGTAGAPSAVEPAADKPTVSTPAVQETVDLTTSVDEAAAASTHEATPAALVGTPGSAIGIAAVQMTGEPVVSALSPAAAAFIPAAASVGEESGVDPSVFVGTGVVAGERGAVDAAVEEGGEDTEVCDQEEEQGPQSPLDLGIEGEREEPGGEGEEQGGYIEVMDLVDDEEEDEEEEEENNDAAGGEEDGEVEMEEAEEGAEGNDEDEGFDEEEAEDGGEEGEDLEDADMSVEEDLQPTQGDGGSAMPPPVALSRANTTQVEAVNQIGSSPTEPVHTPLKTQDSNVHGGTAHAAAAAFSPPGHGTRPAGEAVAEGGIAQTGAMRTSSAVSPGPSGTAAAGGETNDDDGGGDGGDDNEHSSRDPSTRRSRRPIQFDLTPRMDTAPGSMSGPSGEGVPRTHPNLPVLGRGQPGNPAFRGGLMRGRRGTRARGRGRGAT